MGKTGSKQKRPTAWKPGESGNPNGRPSKGYSIAETMREMFASSPEKKQQLVNAMFEKAINGDTQAAKYLSSYVDGMPVQTVKQHDMTLEDLINNEDESA